MGFASNFHVLCYEMYGLYTEFQSFVGAVKLDHAVSVSALIFFIIIFFYLFFFHTKGCQILRKLTGIILHVHTFCILFTQLNLLEYAGNISCVSNYIIRRAPDFVSARLQICARKYIVLRKVHFCVSKKIYLLTQHIQSRFRNFY